MEKHSAEHRHEREKQPEIERGDSHDHLERMRRAHEHEGSRHNHDPQETKKAEMEALKEAETTDHIKDRQVETKPSHEKQSGPITTKQLDREFTETMDSIRDEMSFGERNFSKFIHNKGVEKTSEFLGATIARPNALLAGSIGAFALTLAIYIFAKTLGYPLSGFEPVASFVLGWVLGLLYDYFRVMVTGKR